MAFAELPALERFARSCRCRHQQSIVALIDDRHGVGAYLEAILRDSGGVSWFQVDDALDAAQLFLAPPTARFVLVATNEVAARLLSPTCVVGASRPVDVDVPVLEVRQGRCVDLGRGRDVGPRLDDWSSIDEAHARVCVSTHEAASWHTIIPATGRHHAEAFLLAVAVAELLLDRPIAANDVCELAATSDLETPTVLLPTACGQSGRPRHDACWGALACNDTSLR